MYPVSSSHRGWLLHTCTTAVHVCLSKSLLTLSLHSVLLYFDENYLLLQVIAMSVYCFHVLCRIKHFQVQVPVRTFRQFPFFPLPWASVHWLVPCTLECHWKVTGWPSVHWDTAGPPSEYLQCTLEHHWKKLRWNSPTLECQWKKLSWIRPTLGCHWRNSNFCSLHWNTTGGTVTAHTRPDTYSEACRVASMPVWNDKMAGHQ